MTVIDNIELLGYISLVFGIIYMIMQIFQKHYMWYFCLVSSITATVVAIDTHVWANAGFNAYSAVMAVVGIISWRKFKQEDLDPKKDLWRIQRMHIVKMTNESLVTGAFLIVAVSAGLFFLLRFLNDPLPLADGTGMAFGVVATIWLTKSHKEHWYLWLASDFISIVIYVYQQVWPMALLYFAYFISAIAGICIWNKYGKIVA